jgi:hypothetical protein
MNTAFRYFYLRNKMKEPVVCVAYLADRNECKATYGIAVFNPDEERVYYEPVKVDDQIVSRIPVPRKVIFDRTFLRELATGRLVSYKKEASFPSRQYASLPSIEQSIVQTLLKEKGLPKRAKQAVKLWLANQELKNKKSEFTLDEEENETADAPKELRVKMH